MAAWHLAAAVRRESQASYCWDLDALFWILGGMANSLLRGLEIRRLTWAVLSLISILWLSVWHL